MKTMKLNLSKQWYRDRIAGDDGGEIAAGIPGSTVATKTLSESNSRLSGVKPRPVVCEIHATYSGVPSRHQIAPKRR
jgi:hypothetical protein